MPLERLQVEGVVLRTFTDGFHTPMAVGKCEYKNAYSRSTLQQPYCCQQWPLQATKPSHRYCTCSASEAAFNLLIFKIYSVTFWHRPGIGVYVLMRLVVITDIQPAFLSFMAPHPLARLESSLDLMLIIWTYRSYGSSLKQKSHK